MPPATAPPLPKGIYAPIITPFLDNEEVDYDSLAKHVVRLGRAQCGLVLQGTTAEAIHLTRQERTKIISTCKEALDKENLSHIPIIAGCGTGSVKETIELTKDAHQAGAEATLIIAPGFFGGQLKGDRKALKEYWWEIAEKSPLPVLVYNFPAVTGGIDVDSDLLEEIAAHPNVVGCKLTCANIGKGHRLVTSPAHAAHPSRDFLVMTGYCDILLPSMMAGLEGSITALANLTPNVVVQQYHLIKSAIETKDWNKLALAQRQSEILSRADWSTMKGGLAGVKWAVGEFWPETGVKDRVRRPLQEASTAVREEMKKELDNIVKMERELEKQSK